MRQMTQELVAHRLCQELRLELLTAAEVEAYVAQRFRAKKSLASLAGCKSLSGKGEPPTRIESCVHGGVVVVHAANKMGEA